MQLGRFTGTDPDDGTHYDDDDIDVVPDPGTEPDAVIAGPGRPAGRWLWRRGDGADDQHHRRRAASYDHFREAVHQPID